MVDRHDRDAEQLGSCFSEGVQRCALGLASLEGQDIHRRWHWSLLVGKLLGVQLRNKDIIPKTNQVSNYQSHQALNHLFILHMATSGSVNGLVAWL